MAAPTRRDASPSNAIPLARRCGRPGSVPSFAPPRSRGPLERCSASGRASTGVTPLGATLATWFPAATGAGARLLPG